MIHKILKVLERMEVLITSHYVKVFLGNKHNSYIHTTGNKMVRFTKHVCEKTVKKTEPI